MNLAIDHYEKEMKSLTGRLDEKDTNLATLKQTIEGLNKNCKKFNSELETMTEKKKKYQHQYEKY